MSDTPKLPTDGPKSLGQILDRVVRLMRTNLKLLFGISAVPPAVLLASLALSFSAIMLPVFSRMPKNPSPAQETQLAAAFFSIAGVVFLLYGATFAPSLAAASTAAVQADLGERMTFREAYSSAFRKYGRNLLLLLLISLISMGPMILLQLIAFATSISMGHRLSTQGSALVLVPASVLVLFACFVFSILAMLRLSLAFPACVAENLTAVDAIKRSKYLTRGASGRIFLVVLVICAISYAVYLLGMLAAAALTAVIGLIGSGLHIHVLPAVRIALIVCLAAGIFALIVLYMTAYGAGFATAVAVIYHDQRVRFEGSTIPTSS